MKNRECQIVYKLADKLGIRKSRNIETTLQNIILVLQYMKEQEEYEIIFEKMYN